MAKLKRSKLVNAAIMLTLAVSGAFWICSTVSSAFTPAETVEYHVEADDGDTVWSLCGKVASDKDDLRYLVRQTLDENHISNGDYLQPGQQIIIRPKKV